MQFQSDDDYVMKDDYAKIRTFLMSIIQNQHRIGEKIDQLDNEVDTQMQKVKLKLVSFFPTINTFVNFTGCKGAG